MKRRSVQLVLAKTSDFLHGSSASWRSGVAGTECTSALRPATQSLSYSALIAPSTTHHAHIPPHTTRTGPHQPLPSLGSPTDLYLRTYHICVPSLRAEGSNRPDESSTGTTAEDTDRIVAELRYRNITVPRSLDISLARRLENMICSAGRLLKSAMQMVLSTPGVILSFARMSPSEWRSTLSGWAAVLKHEGAYYWAGFKLFGFELRVASRLVFKQLRGGSLSRREKKQLTRTTADVFRMVPFSLFIIVPFAEALLPVALKLFPNMLPSTFQSKLKQEEDLKKLLTVKTELARFLQQTVGELAKDLRKSGSTQAAADAKELYKFLKNVRAGDSVSNNDILKFARLFDDELTLDNLDRVHLATLCQFVGLSHMGTNEFLRMRLRTHLNAVKADDMEIKQEGLDQLTDDELRSACRARGMGAPFGAGCTEHMRKSLSDWMELSLDRCLPPSLLLLSRAFKLAGSSARKSKALTAEDEAFESVQSLKDTIGMLPEETIEDVEMESFNSSTSMAKKLEYLKREEEIILEESKASGELAAARAELEKSEDRLELVQEKGLQAKAKATAQAVMREATARAVRSAIGRRDDGSFNLAEGESQEEKMYQSATAEKARMKKVISALVSLANASGVSQERALFMEVAKGEVDNMLVKMSNKRGSQMLFTDGGLQVIRPVDEAEHNSITKNVSEYVSNILIRIEADIDRAESKIGDGLHLIDKDNDGFIDRAEMKAGLELLEQDLTPEEMSQLMDLVGSDDKCSVRKLRERLRAADAKA